MDFKWSEEERMLRHLFADFFASEFAPPVARAGEREIGGGGAGNGFQKDIWQSLTELGILQLTLPEAAGGVELGETGAVLLAEQMGRAAYQSPYMDTVTAAHLLHAAGAGSPLWQRLERITEGSHLIALGVRHAPQLVFTEQGQAVAIEGECRFVPFAAQSDELLLRQGTRLLLVPTDAAGVQMRRQDDIGRGELYAVQFSGVTVKADASVDLAEEVWEDAFAKARVRQSAYLVGLSQGALDWTIRYTKERKQFGQPLATNQSLAYRMAAMAARIEAARLLAAHTAWEADGGRDVARISMQALALAGDLALDVTTEALQMHGSFGLCEEAEAQRFYRRAIADLLLWERPVRHRLEAAHRLVAEQAREAVLI